MEIAGHAFYRLLEFGGGALDLALQTTQLVELHLATDVRLHFIDVALQTAEQVPQHARGLGQTLRPDHDQRHDGDDDNFREAYVEHGMGAFRAMDALTPLRS